jgi:hypothetical protein
MVDARKHREAALLDSALCGLLTAISPSAAAAAMATQNMAAATLVRRRFIVRS